MNKIYYPLLADSHLLTPEESLEIRNQLRNLPMLTQRLLLSAELPQAIDRLVKQYALDEETILFVSVMIRKILFREWDLKQSAEELMAWCREVDEPNIAHVQDIVAVIEKDILTIVPKEEVSGVGEGNTPAHVRVGLLEALSRFPQLGQQTVTEARVKLKGSTEPVRGSLLNWIKCYREELGVGYHDAMTRGQFLFRSQNGSKLSDAERERIGLLLRSIEDSELLEIDSNRQEIIFPVVATIPSKTLPQTAFPPVSRAERQDEAPRPPQLKTESDHQSAPLHNSELSVSPSALGSMRVAKPAPPAFPRAAGTLSFSSKHVLPAEKDLLVQSDTERDTPTLPPTSVSAPTPIQPPQAPKRDLSYIPNPFRIDPVSNDRLEEE